MENHSQNYIYRSAIGPASGPKIIALGHWPQFALAKTSKTTDLLVFLKCFFHFSPQCLVFCGSLLLNLSFSALLASDVKSACLHKSNSRKRDYKVI